MSEWIVPPRYGDTDVQVAGELTWSPPPPSWLVWAMVTVPVLLALAAGPGGTHPRLLGAPLLGGAVAACGTRRRRPSRPSTGPRTPARSLPLSCLPAPPPSSRSSVCAPPCAGAGRCPGSWPSSAAGCHWCRGLPDVDALWSADDAAAGPQPVARAAGAVLVALGAGLVLGGIAAVRRFREARPRVGRPDAALPVG